MSEEHVKKSSSKFIWRIGTGKSLIIFSVIWGLLITFIALQTKGCDLGNCIHHFTPNELGDFLAGAFAPLAFIWLAGAVFIQARELRKQREVLLLQKEELLLTREEMQASRDVMKLHADTAKETTHFIGLQTELLSAESRQREMNEADKQFSLLGDSLEMVLNRYSGVTSRLISEVIADRKTTFYLNQGFWTQDHKIRNLATLPASIFGDDLEQAKKKSTKFELKFSVPIFDDFMELKNILENCIHLYPKLSVYGVVRYDQFRINDALTTINLLEKGHIASLAKQYAPK